MVNWHPLGTIWHPLEGPGRFPWNKGVPFPFQKATFVRVAFSVADQNLGPPSVGHLGFAETILRGSDFGKKINLFFMFFVFLMMFFFVFYGVLFLVFFMVMSSPKSWFSMLNISLPPTVECEVQIYPRFWWGFRRKQHNILNSNWLLSATVATSTFSCSYLCYSQLLSATLPWATLLSATLLVGSSQVS